MLYLGDMYLIPVRKRPKRNSRTDCEIIENSMPNA
jgi:hypothetical protein